MTLDDVWNAISGKESEKSLTESEIASLNDRIDALKAAYDKLDAAKENIKDNKRCIAGLDDCYDGYFAGSRASADYTSMDSSGDLNSAYASYITYADDMEDAINNTINDLNEQLNEQYGWLGQIKSALDDLYTMVRNWVN